jgi:hypothetical protein
MLARSTLSANTPSQQELHWFALRVRAANSKNVRTAADSQWEGASLT